MVTSSGSFVAGPLDTKISSHYPTFFSSLFGGAGLVMQRIEASGVIFLHAGGAIARRELAPDERMLVNPGCLLAYAPKQPGAEMWDVECVKGISNMLLGQGLFVGTLEGPGIVWLQSMPWSVIEDAIVAKSRTVIGRALKLVS